MATIYICGIDSSPNEEKDFVDADKLKAKFSALKCAVVNPMEIAFPKMSWSDKLESRVELLKKSQAVYVLPNWREDIMSRIELTLAMDMKLHTFFHPVSNKELKKLITTLDS